MSKNTMTKKQIEEILIKLQTDENYYGEFGRQFLSNSNIRTLLTDPLNFGNPTEPHLNLVKGQYFHNIVLEPEKKDDFLIIDASTRNTKIYKETAGNEICLLTKERDELEDLVEIMLRNPTAHDLIRDFDVEYEVPGLINLEGEWWKLKADIVNRTQGFIVDIKTTGDIDKFASSAWTFNYDSQAYIYSEYFNLDFIFVVMCKKSRRLGIFDCSPEFLARGKQKVKEGVAAYRKYTDKSFDPNTYFMSKTL
jgi:hypothetical protein|tara:strand:+ start:2546 stop:3298 length:753 start_codon:yes stop_codon:yes gene_type:complete